MDMTDRVGEAERIECMSVSVVLVAVLRAEKLEKESDTTE